MKLDQMLSQVTDADRRELIRKLANMTVVHPAPLGDLLMEAADEIYWLSLRVDALTNRMREMERRLTAAELEL